MKKHDSTEVEVDADSVEFWHNGNRYYTSGVVIHQCYEVDSGIGWYEYWGHMEKDEQIGYCSEYKDAQFVDITIWDGLIDIEPSGEILELAKEALFEKTRTRAEESLCDS